MLDHRVLRPLSFAIGALLACAAAQAQVRVEVAPTSGADVPATDANGRPISRGEQKAIRDFQLLDANHDNRLSRDEVAFIPQLSAAFDEADTDHDGYVSQDEIRAFSKIYRARRDAAKRAAQQQQQQQHDGALP
ncbi:EF-hand domain-containing protein [Xylophilus sp.]|uniref:EF-hand domain-containing protein n=1 Tax=Xylophilus sp. TaxID=2653893 RepID=UPI0013BDC3D1|nr:EF-hand domain-containing protein [Xylophilus sp.]KAF1049001.1 MAG: hypothetical protein GAK38_01116 [Xylophilus sp.]